MVLLRPLRPNDQEAAADVRARVRVENFAHSPAVLVKSMDRESRPLVLSPPIRWEREPYGMTRSDERGVL